jgi:hypothetical protein
VYIGNEIAALVNVKVSDMTVRAHRVGVHIGHFVDVRVKVRVCRCHAPPPAQHRCHAAVHRHHTHRRRHAPQGPEVLPRRA